MRAGTTKNICTSSFFLALFGKGGTDDLPIIPYKDASISVRGLAPYNRSARIDIGGIDQMRLADLFKSLDA